jgi:uncharacterized protein
VNPGVLEDAIWRLGDTVAQSGVVSLGKDQPNPVAGHLLLAATPRLNSEEFAPKTGESAVEFAVRVVSDLDETILAIQGPPGSGKTFSGAEMICALVEQGKKVGVAATGHEVIQNLLNDVGKAAQRKGLDVRLAHRTDDPEVAGEATTPIDALGANDVALTALQSGEADVLGGTAWLWARAEFASAVDVLFVDEAGQMSLANVLAVSAAANSIVLLGDPQQLDQPQKGSHPEGVNASALQHILGEHQTIPDDRGIFLPVTWRLAPAFVSSPRSCSTKAG